MCDGCETEVIRLRETQGFENEESRPDSDGMQDQNVRAGPIGDLAIPRCLEMQVNETD